MRYAAWLLIAGCSSTPGETPAELTPLQRLEAKTNAYASFHLRAELTDGRQTVPIELAWRAPDRALLRYGPNNVVVFSGGIGRTLSRRSVYSFPYAERLAALRERYGNPPIGNAPELVFELGGWEALLLGRGLRATLGYGRLGARLGWLEELRAYAATGPRYRRGPVEVELRDDGFIERVQAGERRFEIRELTIDAPVPDSVFTLPQTEGVQDATAGARRSLEAALEDSFHRWVLQTDPDGPSLESLVKVDLARRYDPAKMADVLRRSLAESLETWHRLTPQARPEALKAKLLMDRGKTMGSIQIMEDEIQRDFEKDLDRYFRGMSIVPPAARMEAIARKWRAAVTRQIDAQIRIPFQGVFDEAER